MVAFVFCINPEWSLGWGSVDAAAQVGQSVIFSTETVQIVTSGRLQAAGVNKTPAPDWERRQEKATTGKHRPTLKHQSRKRSSYCGLKRRLIHCGTGLIVFTCGLYPSTLCSAIWKLTHQLLWHGKTLLLCTGEYTNIIINCLDLIRTADISLVTKTSGIVSFKRITQFSLIKSLAGVNCRNWKFQQMCISFFSTENLQGKKLNVQDNMKTSQIHQLHH